MQQATQHRGVHGRPPRAAGKSLRIRSEASRWWWPLPLPLLLLAGCAAAPFGGASRDGPEAHPPPNLILVPDAEPRLEPVRSGGPNKPYDYGGRTYVPMVQDVPFAEHGLASWYGRKFQGKPTSSGEPYDMYAMTAAHPTLPIPSYARVRNPGNGREVIVRINDRGPFSTGRIIDLSYTAALKLDVLRGVTPVELDRITFEDIRTGAWRRPQAARPAMASAAAPTPAPTLTLTPPVASSTTSSSSTPMPSLSSSPPQPPVDVDAGAVATVDDLSIAPRASMSARGFWVQLGAFRQRAGAEGFRQQVSELLAWLAPSLSVFDDATWFRLQAGPYPSRDDAQHAAERVREALQLTPVIVERR